MTSICSSVPTVNNGRILSSSSNQAEFECLSGFQLVGSKVISCDDTSGWETVPTCDVIIESDTIGSWGPEWFMILLAILLILLLLSCTGCFIWACFCKRRDERFLCFGGESGGSNTGQYHDESELLYNDTAGVYTMADGTMFIPVRPIHKGEYGKGGYHHRNQDEDDNDGGVFGCCGGSRRKRRPSADMVFDETEGIYTLKDGSMYTPVKPQKKTDANGRVVWVNQADPNSRKWYTHQGGFHGEITGNKSRKYDPKDVGKFSPNEFKTDKQNGHWFIEDVSSPQNNRTVVTTKFQDQDVQSVDQNPTTVYILEDDPRLKKEPNERKPKPKPKQQPIVVKSVESPKFLVNQPREKTEVIVLRAQDLRPNENNNNNNLENNDDEESKNAKKDVEKDGNKQNQDGSDGGKKGGKTKPKVVVINVNHKYDKGRSKPKSEPVKEEPVKPVPKEENFVSRSLPARAYTPSETGTRDTFSMADVDDLIANEINDSGMDRSTDDEEPYRPHADDKFVDTVTKQLILEKMRQKKRNDKVWIPHSHPVRNTKHFTK